MRWPRGESNLRTRFRRALLYPLSYGGARDNLSSHSVHRLRAAGNSTQPSKLTIRVQEVRGVVAGSVVAVTGCPIRAEPGLEPGAMERVHLSALPSVEAEMEVLGGGRPIDNIQVGETRPPLALRELRDSEGTEDRLVEADALRVVARVHVDVIEDPERPVPVLDAHEDYLANSVARDSRITVTLIWPGYSSSCSMSRAISCESSAAWSSSISAGLTMTRISRPACSAYTFSTPSFFAASSSSASSRLM